MDGSGDHLPFALLADIAEQRVSPDGAAQAHLAACRQCAEDLAWLQETISLLRARKLEEPPAQTVEQVKALFRQRTPRPQRRPILAALGFDSRLTAPAFGLRSSAPAERQLIYHAAPYSIDLRIKPLEGRWVVAGQLLSGDEGAGISPGGKAEILGPAGGATAEMD